MNLLSGSNPKLPEHILTKSDLNQCPSLKQGRVIICAEFINVDLKDEAFAKLIDSVKTQQLVINGRSMNKYAEVIRTWNESIAHGQFYPDNKK